MTPKEKAKELFIKMRDTHPDGYYHEAQNAALICVDEILKLRCLSVGWTVNTDLPNNETMQPYWQEVKQEIEKL